MARLGDVCQKATSNIAQKDLEGHSGVYPIYGASGFISNIDFYQQGNPYIAVVKDGAGIGRIMKLPAKSSIIGTMQYIIPNDNVNIGYLAYAMEHMNLSKYFTGATIPHIYFKDYQAEELPLPPMEEQIKIAAVLDKVSDLIAKRRRQLDKLDLLVKARFVERFGEPGTKKSGLQYVPLDNICLVNPKKNQESKLKDGLQVSFVPMSFVTETGDIDASCVKDYNEVKTGFTYFAENDVLFAKITPCMENGKGAIAKNLKNGIGFGSTEFHVLRPIDKKSDPYWLYILTSFKQFRDDAASNMTGSAGQRRVPASFLEKYLVSVPPFELQKQFSIFVQYTEQTKTSISHSLEKLETLKKSLMQEYFG